MKTFLPIFLLFLSINGLAQFSERKYIDRSVENINQLKAADLNQDGKVDIVIAGHTGIAWQENVGTPEEPIFGGQQVLTQEATSFNYNQIIVEDVDNDGFMDIVAASFFDDKVIYIKNLGSGQFEDSYLITSSLEEPSKMDIGDMDGDGDLDILVRVEDQMRIIRYHNDKYTLTTSQVPANTFYVHIGLVDADEDGDLDATFSSHLGLIRYYENPGGGSFPFPNTQNVLIANFGNSDYNETTLGDLDNDGDLDFLSTITDVNQPLAYIENMGNGNYGEINYLSMAQNLLSKSTVLDIDKDDQADIIAQASDTTLLWYKGQGGFNFAPAIEIKMNEVPITSTVYIDINNDGLFDILSTDGVRIYFNSNEGAGIFSQKQTLYHGAKWNREVKFADFDGDNLKDIYFASSASNVVSWYKKMENGQFSAQRILLEIEEVERVHAADLDNDGDMDLITFAPGIGTEVHENLGNFQFNTPVFLSTFGNYIFTLDIDNDGDQDIFSGASLKCYINQGSFNFAEPHILASSFSSILPPAPTDMDGDGDFDFVGGWVNDNRVDWIENVGTLDFVLHPIAAAFDSPFSVQATDLSGDGLLDIMVSSRDEHTISLFTNVGNETFSNPEIILAGVDYPRDAFTIDFDMDGDLDIISSVPDQLQIILFGNLGNGNFDLPVYIDENIFSFETKAEDLDFDGDMDLISVGFNGDIRWYENMTINNAGNVIRGIVFLDENENGIQESNEIALQRFPMQLNPLNQQSFSSNANNNASYQFALSDGDYTITPDLSACWELTTSPEQYEININDNSPVILSGFNFGVKSISEERELQVALNAGSPTRCGFTVPYNLSITNNGCTTAKGKYGFLPSELATLVQSIPSADEVVNDTLFWNYNDLYPFQAQYIYLEYEIAGQDFIGEIIEMPTVSYFENDSGILNAGDDYLHLSEINCAYDPNDKQVVPSRSLEGIYKYNYTLFSEDLEYTIRFQNTGSDTAFTVVITDELSEDLDWNTFRPGYSSHTYRSEISENGQLVFTFENILLPDSTTNEIASHGFINFSISAKSDLPDFTPIPNAANIFFDFNEAIVTNATENIMVDPLPPIAIANFSHQSNMLNTIFTDESQNSPTSWLWDFGDGQTSTDQNPSHLYASPGEYLVCLSTENEFSKDSICKTIEVIISSTSAIANYTFTYQVIPNPTHGTTFLKFPLDLTEQVDFTLYNTTGQLVKIPYTIEQDKIIFDAGSMEKGFWIFAIEIAGEKGFGKFMVL